MSHPKLRHSRRLHKLINYCHHYLSDFLITRELLEREKEEFEKDEFEKDE